MKYTINYNTGAGNRTIRCDSMGDAKSIADEGASYTQRDIEIIDAETGTLLAWREWYGVEYSDGDADDPIRFGSFGFFGDWEQY